MFWLWDPDPLAFAIGGFGISWYGLLWALGFLFAQRVVIFIYRKEGKPGRDLDALLIYLIVGTVVGARLGHCLFYDPLSYVRNPVAILKVWEGGLASHGAAAGILASLFLFSRRKKDQSFLWLVDRIVIVSALVGGLVRVGNFINSEVLGTPTRSPFGVVFAAPLRAAVLESDPSIGGASIGRSAGLAPPGAGSVPLRIVLSPWPGATLDVPRVLQRVREGLLMDGDARKQLYAEGSPRAVVAEGADPENPSVTVVAIARHPVQLYEAAVCFILMGGLYLIWWRRRSGLPRGLLFGWFLVVTFASRFLLEFLKEPVTPTEAGLPLTMGQLLSIPFVLVGAWLLLAGRTRRNPS